MFKEKKNPYATNSPNVFVSERKNTEKPKNTKNQGNDLRIRRG